MKPSIRKPISAFLEDRSGAAMVEFAIALPLLLLVLAVVVEGSRIGWTHQAAASGVRDASRFIARIAESNICNDAAAQSTFTDDYATDASDIVTLRVGSADEQILPGGVNVISVTPTVRCEAVTYNASGIPIVEVRARLEIEFPFGGVFDLFGDPLEPLTTEISDQSRIFGI